MTTAARITDEQIIRFAITRLGVVDASVYRYCERGRLEQVAGAYGGEWFVLSIRRTAGADWQVVARRRTKGELLELVEDRTCPRSTGPVGAR